MSLKIPALPIKLHAHRPHGQGMVEFALLIPLLVLIVFGVTDLGRAFQALIAVTNASREGARQGIFSYNRPATIVTAAVREAASFGIIIDGSDVTSSCGLTPVAVSDACPRGEPLHVNVCYDFLLITRFVFSDPIPICRFTEMRVP